MRRPLALAGLLAVVLAAAATAPAGASPGASYGIQDDAWLLDGPGELSQRIGTLRLVGVKLVRFTLRWDKVAPARPTRPRDPGDPAYDWAEYGQVLDALHAAGIAALVTLYGAPAWSNGGHAPNWLPASTAIGDFASAASEEFSVGPSLDGVERAEHADVLGAGLAGAVRRARSQSRIRGTASRERPQPRRGRRHVAEAAAERDGAFGLRSGHERRARPARRVRPEPVPALAERDAVRDELRVVRRLDDGANPPDANLGVTLQRQAGYIGEAALRVWEQPGVTMLIQFLVQDEPAIGGWQSGLFTAVGKPKPSYHAFGLPLAEVSRRGAETTLWGEVRPGSGRRAYRIERSAGAHWVAAAAARTRPDGAFLLTLALAAGTRVRLTSAGVAYASPTLVIS